MTHSKKILFYYTSNQRSIAIESVMLAFKEQGHSVCLLTQSEKGALHQYCQEQGIPSFAFSPLKKNAVLHYLRHIRFLIKFIKKEHIDLVYSHLQQANFVAVYASKFCRAKVYVCRHHSDTHLGENKNLRRQDAAINKHAKVIVVPSKKVYNEVLQEGVPASKIKLIPYGYNFAQYAKPNNGLVEEIKTNYSGKLLLLSVARLVPDKRHEITIKAMAKLVHDVGFDVKLLIISEGPEKEKLQQLITQCQLSNHVFLLGYKNNVVDYLSAADVVVQMAETEASNNLVKEAALFEKPVIVCKNVGDYDEYMIHLQNAFLLPKEEPVDQLVETLHDIIKNKYKLAFIGSQLKKTVIEKFAIENVIAAYTELNT